MLNPIPFISYVFVVTFTPGPNNIMSMFNANKYGYKKTLNFMLGIFTGFFIIMIICSYFNLLLFNIIPTVKVIMGTLGSIYMIYLAFKIITSKETLNSNDNKKLNSFYTGIIMQFVNIKVILFGLTVTSNFIIPYFKSDVILILFSLSIAFTAFISISCWAVFGVVFSKILLKYRSLFNIIMGLLLIYSAVSVSGII